MTTQAHIPTDIRLLQKSRLLELHYEDGESYSIPCAYLRKHSPSAEAQESDIISNEINITSIQPVGHYAIKLFFDDGHNTGIYSWELLHELGQRYTTERSQVAES